ncbi:MAG: sulfurtransferase TusA family protein [Pseudomonadota bacterium]
MARHVLDARRLLCPLPVIRTQNAIRTLAPGDVLEVTATDPGVLQDIPAWCRVHGHRVLEAWRDGAEIRVDIEVCAPKAP